MSTDQGPLFSTNDTLRMLAESAAPSETRSDNENAANAHLDDDEVILDMSDREKANEMLMAKELKNLQFENPGTNQVLAEYGSIGTSRRKRAVRQKNEQRTERKDPYHDEKGKLVVNGERFTLCDCLRAACSGCHWPCPRCGSRRCGPVCQVNRTFAYQEISDPYANVHHENPFINDH